MMELEKLAAYGANVEEGLARCMGMKGFYLGLVEKVRDEPAFDKLRIALDEGRLDEAFEYSHSLKGVLTNLAITPLSEPVCEICELLRSRTQMDYSQLMGTIMQRYEEFRQL